MGRSATTDPLEKFRFLVDFMLPGPDAAGTTPVRTGFHDIQMPKRSTNKIMYREGHSSDTNTKSAGLSDMEDIVMSNGVLPGDGAAANDLYKWMRAVHNPTTGSTGFGGTAASQATGKNLYRTEVTIKMLDREGKVVRAWKMYQAWPTNFTPGSDLNAAEDGDKSLQTLTLCYEDFQELSVASAGSTPGAPL